MESELINGDFLLKHLEEKKAGIPQHLKVLVTESANITRTHINLAVPVKTGNLQRSTKIDNISDFEKRIFIDLNQARYGEYIIRGTEPYEILPVNKKALYWPGADHPVKRVEHPGIKANDYFTAGIENADSEVQAEIDKFKEWITG